MLISAPVLAAGARTNTRRTPIARLVVILENSPDSELDREEVEYHEGDDPTAAADDAIMNVLEGWTLNVGDTIKIREA